MHFLVMLIPCETHCCLFMQTNSTETSRYPKLTFYALLTRCALLSGTVGQEREETTFICSLIKHFLCFLVLHKYLESWEMWLAIILQHPTICLHKIDIQVRTELFQFVHHGHR